MKHREPLPLQPISCPRCGKLGTVELSTLADASATRDDRRIEALSEGFQNVNDGWNRKPIEIDCADCKIPARRK